MKKPVDLRRPRRYLTFTEADQTKRTQTMTTFNTEILAAVTEDFGVEHIVTRTAAKIAAKGFSLVDVQKQKGMREGFNWGRSSHGETSKTLYLITFENDANEEFGVTVIGQIINYTKRNPYDRVPADNGKESFAINPHNEATKKVLGWKGV